MTAALTLAAFTTACQTAGPGAAVAVLDPDATLVELYSEPGFFEGPVWSPREQKLYFTAFGKDGQQILRLEQPGVGHVWMDRTAGVNGTCRARDGRMLGAQAYGHRVVALAFGGPSATELVTLAEDPNWNQPNDVCQAPNDDIYFTDPDFRARAASAVYRLPGHAAAGGRGTPTRVVTDMPAPNGLAVSNDGRTLYVSDSFEKHWRAYPINDDGSVGPGRVFFDPLTDNRDDPDGLTIDERGNLYLTGRGGLWIVGPDGTLRTFVRTPVFCSNVCFGGADGRTLFITGKGKVFALRTNMRGAD